MGFQVGDKIVYPNQGVGIIEQVSSRNLTGQPETFYLLKLGTNGMRVMVPMTNVANVGLRRVSKSQEVGLVLEYLHRVPIKTHSDWKSRFKENSEKMRTGTLKDVAEVLKTLLVLNQAKPLSFREKRMLDRAWQLLVDEISVARGVARQAVEEQLVKALGKSNLKVPLPS
ncbi:MAG TPA: CarD family transcriptional regulator [Terriglobia bacterium]|jgi:CarD family transcriptional regulator|nr:CarD family transcriptional regulator [Terriglobia bacterium]